MDYNKWVELTRSYSVWDDKNIKGFFGEYRWLSNFYPSIVFVEWRKFPTVEHAYQYGKLLIEDSVNPQYYSVVKMTAKEVRTWGQKIEKRPDWDEVKYDVMLACVFDKFWRNYDLKEKLLETGNKYLEESNHWKDVWWGTDFKTGQGQNNLGKILMKIRECLKR